MLTQLRRLLPLHQQQGRGVRAVQNLLPELPLALPERVGAYSVASGAGANDQIEKWNEQRENGSFPAKLDD